VPLLVRWPGVLEPGRQINEIISHQDWLPTFLAAAGVPDVKERLLEGHRANGKDFKVHLDGYNFLPYLKGEAESGPREELGPRRRAGAREACLSPPGRAAGAGPGPRAPGRGGCPPRAPPAPAGFARCPRRTP
jgi:hypothetical protein